MLWGAAVPGTARELLTEPEDDSQHGSTKEAASDWLQELLADCAVPVKQIKSDAAGAGYSWITVRRAADDLDVIRKKAGMDAGWFWSLPKVLTKESKVLTPEHEHLRGEMSTFGAADDEDEREVVA